MQIYKKTMELRQIENNPTVWKYISIFSLITFLVSILGDKGKVDYFYILSGIYLIPLFGLAFEKPIWSTENWKILFWLACIGLVGMVVLLVFAYFNSMLTFNTVEDNQTLARILGVALLLLIVFELRGLYLYAYQRDYIWIKK